MNTLYTAAATTAAAAAATTPTTAAAFRSFKCNRKMMCFHFQVFQWWQSIYIAIVERRLECSTSMYE